MSVQFVFKDIISAFSALARVFVNQGTNKTKKLSHVVSALMTATTVLTMVTAQLATQLMITEFLTIRQCDVFQCQVIMKTDLKLVPHVLMSALFVSALLSVLVVLKDIF